MPGGEYFEPTFDELHQAPALLGIGGFGGPDAMLFCWVWKYDNDD